MSAVVTSKRKRADFTWSATRLRAMVMNHAAMSLPCQREGVDAAQRAQEGLRREVLGQRPLADPHEEVAVHGVDVGVVELTERLPVTALGQLDEGDDARVDDVLAGHGRGATRTRRRLEPGHRGRRPVPLSMAAQTASSTERQLGVPGPARATRGDRPAPEPIPRISDAARAGVTRGAAGAALATRRWADPVNGLIPAHIPPPVPGYSGTRRRRIGLRRRPHLQWSACV